jgi:hypothetical protein
LNPRSTELLNAKEIANGCINYMRIDGKSVKSSRIFLGNEYKEQIKELSKYYGVPCDHHKTITFDYDVYFEITKDFKPLFRWKSIEGENMPAETKFFYDRFDHAYHHLMIELVQLQVKSIKTAAGDREVFELYVDGGFTDNDVYIQLLSHYLRDMTLRTTNASLGSALGAAIALSDSELNSKFLKKNFSLKKHVPFIVKENICLIILIRNILQ